METNQAPRNKQQAKSQADKKLVPLPLNLSPVQLATYNHVDAIQYWTIEKCLDALQDSVTKQKAMQSSAVIKPAKIRKATLQRLKMLIQNNNDSISLQQLVTDVINAQSYLIDQMIPNVGPIQPLHLPPLQGYTPDKMTQLNHRLTQMNRLLNQVQQHQQQQHQEEEKDNEITCCQQTQISQKKNNKDSFRSTKVHQIEIPENYQKSLEESAQRVKAGLQASKKDKNKLNHRKQDDDKFHSVKASEQLEELDCDGSDDGHHETEMASSL